MSDRIWNYRAKIVRVIDGDTVDADIDVGFRVVMRQRLRLLGINAPELKNETIEAAKQSRDTLKEMIQIATDSHGYCHIRTEKADVFGRYLALLYMGCDTNRTVNSEMVDGGWAVEDKR